MIHNENAIAHQRQSAVAVAAGERERSEPEFDQAAGSIDSAGSHAEAPTGEGEFVAGVIEQTGQFEERGCAETDFLIALEGQRAPEDIRSARRRIRHPGAENDLAAGDDVVAAGELNRVE